MRIQKLLAVGDYILTPAQDGGSSRLFQILRLLRESVGHVAFLPRSHDCPHQEGDLAAASRHLLDNGIDVPGHPLPEDPILHLEKYASSYDAILLSGAYVAAALLPKARASAPQAALIYDTVDLHHLRLYREAKLSGSAHHLKQALLLKKQELRSARYADKTLVVTEHEKVFLEKECPEAGCLVLSNVHEPHPTEAAWSERRSLVFLGAFTHTPNLDATRYLAGEIFPRVADRLPEAWLEIVGSNPPDSVRALANDRVRVSGFVPDLSPVFRRCRVSIAPLRFGAGIKGKVLTSMAFGVPTVISPIAAEGMGLEDGKNVLLAEGPEDFARQILRLYRDPALWNALSANGLAWIRENFSWEATRKRLSFLLSELEIIKNRRA